MNMYRGMNKPGEMLAYNLAPVVKHFFDQFAQEFLPIQSTNTTGTFLHDMNDDCLLEIFSQKSLTPMDLLSLAETCPRFKEITQRIFPKKVAIDYNTDCETYWIETKHNGAAIKTDDDVGRIFQYFGTSLDSFSINWSDRYLKFVAKYSVGTLKELDIGLIKISEDLAIDLKPIFQGLELLSIADMTIECDANVFANCNSLIELRVIRLRKWDVILQNNFPKLERFTFCNDRHYFDFDFDVDFWFDFFERHRKTLKCLNVALFRFNSMDVWLQKFGHICNEVEELQFHADGGTSLCFSNFHNLKRLRVYGASFNVLHEPTSIQFHRFKSLVTLKIAGHFETNILEVLPFLNNLRELDVESMKSIPWTSLPQTITKMRLSNHRPNNNIVELIRHLPNLVDLEIGAYDLHKNELLEIVEVVKNRKTVLTLKCRLDFIQSDESCSNKICIENSKVIKRLKKSKH